MTVDHHGLNACLTTFFNEYIILLKKEKGRTHRKDMCTIPFQRIQIAKRESIKSTND